ncbi:MAG: hypothetical protein IJ837_01615 [Clostridia bacterium]|nr:hypothetical protein [Clostridia bacterium]
MDKALKYKIILFVAVLFILVLIPSGIEKQSQIQKIAIVSGIGIDKSEKGITLSAQVLVPEPSTNYSPNQTVFFAEEENLAKAISSLELKIGQELGLSHCFIIVVGDEMFNDDITNTLDFLMRSNIMDNNSVLIHTEKKAQEVLEVSSKLSKSDLNNLQNLAKFSHEHYDSVSTSLVNLFNDYLSNCPYTVVGSIKTEDKKSESDSSSKQQSSQQEQQSSENNKTLANNGDAIVLKKGKKIATLKKDDIENFSWLDTNSQKGHLIIENYSDKNAQNLKISLKIMHESANFCPELKNNTPILKTNISFEYIIESIENENGEKQSVQENFYNEEFKKVVENTIKTKIQKTLDLSKENNFDIIKAYNKFNNKFNKKWKNYLKSLKNPDDYIKNLQIIVEVNLKTKL